MTQNCWNLWKWNYEASWILNLILSYWVYIFWTATLILRYDLIIFVELLSFYKFPGDEIPIIRGSALSALEGKNEEIGKQAILKLMEAVDSYIPDPVRQLDKPFLMPVEDVFTIQVN